MKSIALVLISFLLFTGSVFASSPVNINTADATTLAEHLSGIGITKAEAIVAYREKHGPFQHAEDLLQVRGIGKKTLEVNRDLIQIE